VTLGCIPSSCLKWFPILIQFNWYINQLEFRYKIISKWGGNQTACSGSSRGPSILTCKKKIYPECLNFLTVFLRPEKRSSKWLLQKFFKCTAITIIQCDYIMVVSSSSFDPLVGTSRSNVCCGQVLQFMFKYLLWILTPHSSQVSKLESIAQFLEEEKYECLPYATRYVVCLESTTTSYSATRISLTTQT